ncbi:MAG TPA: hypothetical protein DCQ30_11270 [Acidimicrobiaceae bacterium]|nr:hypothetical protein [Acidimicrobiaceae bacterium]
MGGIDVRTPLAPGLRRSLEAGWRAVGSGWRPEDLGFATALFLVIAAAHAGGQEVVYRLNHVPSTGVTFFPGDGVTFAALLLVPLRFCPVVLAATYFAELTSHFILGERVITAFGLAAGNTIGPAVGAALVWHWLRHAPRLSRRRDLVAFLVGGVVIGPAVGTAIGPPFARLTNASSAYLTVTARWWTGDALGVLLIGGLILAWATETRWPVQPRYAVFEAEAVALVLGLLTWFVFWQWTPSPIYLVIPVVGWSALRFGTRGAMTAAAIVAAIAEWATVQGHGEFAKIAGANPDEALWLLQLFLAVVILTGLVLAAQVAEADAEREARLAATEALSSERARLARELHDSVGHTVSVMVLQAGAARMQLPPGETASSEMVESIETTGRSALEELDRLLGLLDDMDRVDEARAPGEDRSTAPGLSRIGALVESVRRTGLMVDLEQPQVLPSRSRVLDQSAYRIIQEALTNSLKHSNAQRVEITIKCTDGRLELSVLDDGTYSPPPSEMRRSGGRGVIGMRERVGLFGGELYAGPGVAGGWEVRASLPLDEAAP